MEKQQIKSNNLLLHINGGLGKVIMASAVVASWKKKYLVIVTGKLPDVSVI